MSEQVLLIDDDPRLLGALKRRLENAGYQVHTARNGSEGLSAAAMFLPDIMILDIRMPEMDGIEVCQILRSVPELIDIPIVVLSASVEDSTIKNILEKDDLVFLRKPYHLPQLLSVIRNTLDRRRAKAAKRTKITP